MFFLKSKEEMVEEYGSDWEDTTPFYNALWKEHLLGQRIPSNLIEYDWHEGIEIIKITCRQHERGYFSTSSTRRLFFPLYMLKEVNDNVPDKNE
jgi:hypothetical protein